MLNPPITALAMAVRGCVELSMVVVAVVVEVESKEERGVNHEESSDSSCRVTFSSSSASCSAGTERDMRGAAGLRFVFSSYGVPPAQHILNSQHETRLA